MLWCKAKHFYLVQLEFVNISQERVNCFLPYYLHGRPQSLKSSISNLRRRIIHLLYREKRDNVLEQHISRPIDTSTDMFQKAFQCVDWWGSCTLRNCCTEGLQNAFWQCAQGTVTKASGEEQWSLLLDGRVLVVHHSQNILTDVLEGCLQSKSPFSRLLITNQISNHLSIDPKYFEYSL